jgi:hypothetical protein
LLRHFPPREGKHRTASNWTDISSGGNPFNDSPRRHVRSFFQTSTRPLDIPTKDPRNTMDPAPSPRRDSTSGMLPPSSPRRNSASTPTRTTQPTRQPSPGPTSSPHAHNAPPHIQPQRRYRPKHYDGNPNQAHTPSSSVDGDLDAISELEVPAGTSPYLNYHGQTSGHGYGHGPNHNYHTQSDTPTRSPRNLVICLDGTHNSFCDHNSNVVRLFELLEKSDRQLCYYDSGVGTQQGPWLYGLKKDFAMVTDLAFAW